MCKEKKLGRNAGGETVNFLVVAGSLHREKSA